MQAEDARRRRRAAWRDLRKNAKHLLVIVAVLIFAAWAIWPKARPDEARAVLSAQGYTQVEITGSRLFGCGREDVYRTGFRAVGPTGVPAQGVVCSGIFKGATVRIEGL